MPMKRSSYVCLLLVFCFTFILCTTIPLMAHEPTGGIQLALRSISADDAQPAADDEVTKVSQTKPKEPESQKPASEKTVKDVPKTQQPEAKKAAKEVTKSQPSESKATVNEPPKSKETDLKKTGKETVKSQQPEPEIQVEDTYPESLDQQVQYLRKEIKKIRDENEARKKLEIPEEEKGQTIDDILSAAGRQYTLLKQGTVGLSYSLGYSYFSSDAISESTTIERRSNHNLTNTITAEYALFNNLTLSAGVPFVYKYNRVGTSEAQDVTELGDVSLSLTVQPLKAGGSMPPLIFSLGLSLPTGESPYEINQSETLSTGSGYYSVSGGFSLSKVIDPLVAFGNINYTYGFKENVDQYWSKTQRLTAVEAGSSLGLSMGFGYALSYQASLNMSTQLSYSFGSKYTINDNQTYKSGSSLSATFNVGTGWRVTQARSIYISLGIGLTNNDADFSLGFRVPFEF